MTKRHAGGSPINGDHLGTLSRREVIDLRIRLAGSQDTKVVGAVQDNKEQRVPGPVGQVVNSAGEHVLQAAGQGKCRT